MRFLKIKILGSFLMLVFASSCKNNHQETILLNQLPCDTTNTKFASVIQPILNTHCNSLNGCHGINNSSILLTSYGDVKDNYQKILSEMNSGKMPKNASKLDNCTILKIQTWVDRGAQNN